MSKLRAALNLKAAKNKWGTILGWAMFDWANSAYALVIAVAIFPSYFLEIASDSLNVFGLQMTDSTLFAWSISFSYLVVAVLSPLLSGIADYGGKRKRFMGFFTTIGGLACISLVLFTNMQTLWIGVAGFILATIGFAGGIVFNNSYLPIITTEDKYDWASAIGFALGFLGSVMLLFVNLLVIQNYEWFGLHDTQDAVLIAFAMVGLWWIGFAQIPMRKLPDDNPQPLGDQAMKKGYQELVKVAKVVWADRSILRYLTAFFLLNAGVQAVLFLASAFAKKELEFETADLILLILVLQLVAIIGALLSAWASKCFGNRYTLIILMIIWTVVCLIAYNVYDKGTFYYLAAFVGMVMGGTQSLTRSTYAKFIPEDTEDTASFFSFYDVTDKVSTVFGTFIFGIVEQLTGNMRYSVLTLTSLFILSLILLFFFVRIRAAKVTAITTA